MDNTENPFMNPAIGMSGFGFLLGWHFIILYQPFPISSTDVLADYMFARQIAINASLCAFFAIEGFALSKLPPKDLNKNHSLAYIAIAIGTIGSIGLTAFMKYGLAITITSTILIGASEATLMLFWLRFYAETSKNYAGQVLGISAVIAAIVAFLIYHLTYEVSIVAIVLLPLISGYMLIHGTKGIPLRHNDLIGTSRTDWESARLPLMKCTAQLMAMAFSFGLLQGCFNSENVLLPVEEPFVTLGAALAGIVVFAMYRRSVFIPNMTPIVNISLILFVCGMIIFPYRYPFVSTAAAFMIMTGFIFYLLLVLILIIDLVRTFDLNLTIVLGVNQAMEYAMFTVGIIAGFLFWGHYWDTPYAAFIVSSISVFVMTVVVTGFSTERPPWRADSYKPKKASESIFDNAEANYENIEDADLDELVVEEVNQQPNLTKIICAKYNLTPREEEVFMLLAKGRNAEYIQNALFISNHTVKTHIYNIYRKLDVHSLQELLDLVDPEA